MAIWDQLLRNRNKQIEKAVPQLPAGAGVTQFTQEQLAGIANQMYGTGVFQPLPRQGWVAGVPFGPNLPLTPSAINPVGDDGRPDPRRWEYPVAWNVFVTEQRLVPWTALRAAADQIDILRRCVEVLKAKIQGLDWDFTFSAAASEMITGNSNITHVRAMQKARDDFTADISRMRNFWQAPDRLNGLSFKEWLGMAMEEILVLDALAIYPRKTLGGDLYSLEIIDGSTIKPLLDDRGMRPMPPHPAYQQILYGFPRGEFMATSDDPSADGEFAADELIYAIRNRRTFTPYGYSPVERSLPLADIYIKRQQWLRAEFTNGVIPDLMFEPDPDFIGTPEQARAWENILNDDLAGQLEARRRARILPPGLKPIDNTGHSEKFSDVLDEYLIKGITGHFGVMPSEIGYTPRSGLGGSGHQEGEAESATVLGSDPMVSWVEDLISDISYKFLGCPRELRFQFDGGRASETISDAQRRDVEIKGGQRTLNESRAELGLPLLDAPEADVPLLMTGTGVMLVTPQGLVSASGDSIVAAAPQDGSTPPQEASQNVAQDAEQDTIQDEEQPPVDREQQREVKAFLTWARKGPQERDFNFTTVDIPTAKMFNDAAREGDYVLAKAIANVVLKKA